jgi:hypothetical protein
MFGYYDKTYLAVTNVINKNGERYLIRLNLPNDPAFEYISFPDDVVRVSIFEVEQKQFSQGYNAFSILVGETSTLEELYEEGEEIVISKLLEDSDCIQPTDPICYYRDEDESCVIFSKIQEGDVVVENIGELEERIMDISNEYEKVKKGISKIKKYVYKK